MTTLVILLLLETQGRALTMVHDLFPLARRGVESHRDRLLAICMVACDVEELPSSSGRAALESMDAGGAGRAVLERRDDVFVHCIGKLGAALGEMPDVVA
jgi:hypothetical protein